MNTKHTLKCLGRRSWRKERGVYEIESISCAVPAYHWFGQTCKVRGGSIEREVSEKALLGRDFVPGPNDFNFRICVQFEG